MHAGLTHPVLASFSFPDLSFDQAAFQAVDALSKSARKFPETGKSPESPFQGQPAAGS